MDESEWQARIDLAACYRLVARMGVDDLIYNHISLRVPGHDDQFLINPYGMLFEEITASSLVKIDIEGRKLDDTPQQVNAAGFVIHGAIHAARHDAACVLHTHSDAGVTITGQEEGLLPLSQFSMWFYQRQGFHPYEGVAIDLAERERLVANLGDRPVLLMRNHGTLTVGRTPAEAFMMLYYFERAARIQLHMQASGTKLTIPPPEVCAKASAQFWGQKGDIMQPGQREWPGLLRQLDRVDPSYRT